MSELVAVDETRIASSSEELLVTMKVDSQIFGVPILAVQDIVEPRQITPVPLAPSAIAGVMNLRGRIVNVIDLRQCLGKLDEDDTNGLMGVTVEYRGDLYTMLVDAIGDVVALPKDEFEKAPATLDENLRRLCTGIYRREDDLLVVLDVERILDEETIMRTPIRTRRRKKYETAKPEPEKKTNGTTGPALPAPEKEASEEEAASETEPGVPAEASAEPAADETTKSGNGVDTDADALTVEEAPAEEAPTGEAAAEPELEVEEEPAGDASLFERFGGEAAVDAAVDLFYRKVLEDPNLAPFFDDIDMEQQAAKLKSFMTMAFGGPSFYSGRDLRDAHAKLVEEKGLSDEHFDAFASHLVGTLEAMEVPQELIDQVVAIVGPTKNDVLCR